MNIEQLLTDAQEMQSFLEITASERPEELIQRLSDLNVIMARSGKLLADAITLQDKAISLAYEHHKDFVSRVPASIASKFINSQAAEINGLVKWLDRINRTSVYQGDNIRTQISFAKEDLKLTRKGY